MVNMSTIWYNHPARDWNSALPVGNGRLGGMVFGGVSLETIALNEDSLWSWGFNNRVNPKAHENLEKLRELIRAGETEPAEELVKTAFFPTGDEPYYRPAGDLRIETGIEDYTNYRHELNLHTGVVATSFTLSGVQYKREVYCSFTRQAMYIKLSGDLDITVYLDKGTATAPDENTLLYSIDNYAVCISAVGDVCVNSGKLHIAGTEATIAASIATDCRYKDYEYTAKNLCHTAITRRFETDDTLSQMMIRSALKLCGEDRADLPTDERLKNFRENADDNGLITLFWDYSKYLMISGSFPGGEGNGCLPLNLQGIWNADEPPPWGSKFTVNINTEMNYWAAEAQNLPECVTPLFEHLKRMTEHGREVARQMYGARGAVCHHNTDIWGDCAPQDHWMPGTIWVMGLAWLSLHIWEHFEYSWDTEFLSEYYYIMFEAARFFIDFLTENEHGELVTCPSVSPENSYYTKDGKIGTLCEAPSMDSQILYALFTAVVESAEILGLSDETGEIAVIKSMRERLPKPSVGKHGQLMEWAADYDEPEPGHRHISHLFALYPGEQIDVLTTPELAEAAKITLDRRLKNGGGHTGWSRAWLINMFGRLGDGEAVYDNIVKLLAFSTYDNLFDMHPPFQIDGNFGGGAGITEALVQSHGGFIRLLPALPEAWDSGTLRGIRLRGGYFLHEMTWEHGKVTKARITRE
jgi:alpha-L-fucosidase 2